MAKKFAKDAAYLSRPWYIDANWVLCVHVINDKGEDKRRRLGGLQNVAATSRGGKNKNQEWCHLKVVSGPCYTVAYDQYAVGGTNACKAIKKIYKSNMDFGRAMSKCCSFVVNSCYLLRITVHVLDFTFTFFIY